MTNCPSSLFRSNGAGGVGGGGAKSEKRKFKLYYFIDVNGRKQLALHILQTKMIYGIQYRMEYVDHENGFFTSSL
jgi:hypothetical protein